MNALNQYRLYTDAMSWCRMGITVDEACAGLPDDMVEVVLQAYRMSEEKMK